MHFDLIVIGGGAAGFFGAIQAAEMRAGLKILILEKSNKLLSKVKISGGGRCNVTHHNYNPFEFSRHYPRGEKALKNLLSIFHAEHTVKWFASKGVILNAESDGRMFPHTNSSQTIIDCFISEAQKLKIKIMLGKNVSQIKQEKNEIKIFCADGDSYSATKILVATGGSPQAHAYQFIADLHHTIKTPIPSLFTFNDSDQKFKDLMGVSVPHAEVKIAGTKFLQEGPVLITHWGLSGPAVIKLSSWAAEYLYQVQYKFTVLVNWLGGMKEDELREILLRNKLSTSKQKVTTHSLFKLPLRLAQRLYALAEIGDDRIWSELSKKELNRLIEYLIRCPFNITGKTTFKEEFVTCGGVDLSEININSMESKKMNNVYFAGEVLNIDGETGGFNFQNAWTTSFIAAKSIASGF
ncbi:NAD(P)/FAD-dependent oxidoreductase [Chryseolinea sp. H1M3-3]|uniref:NAD(P)/FAD-dependent oxidoreductase n=1 Tax=Chryseolinea sp. H1M3-3 TaxID=3034144 RepID=UPI0023EB7757|nr:NAD(P)/FAD-dependent oxidoreductase [Chryseolinea sp. H1M3-3]